VVVVVLAAALEVVELLLLVVVVVVVVLAAFSNSYLLPQIFYNHNFMPHFHITMRATSAVYVILLI
jgi:hypothetical protein